METIGRGVPHTVMRGAAMARSSALSSNSLKSTAHMLSPSSLSSSTKLLKSIQVNREKESYDFKHSVTKQKKIMLIMTIKSFHWWWSFHDNDPLEAEDH